MRYGRTLALLAAVTSLHTGCADLLCAAGPPSFELNLTLDKGVSTSKLSRVRVTVEAGKFRRDKSFSVGQELSDRRTSVVVHLGEQGAEGFNVAVLVLALGKTDNDVRAWAQGTFEGTGDACNFFDLTLQAGAPKDLDGDGVTLPLDCDDLNPCRSPMVTEQKNLCVGKPGTLPAACKTWLAKQGLTMKAPYCGDGVDQDCNGEDVPCAVDEDCDDYSPPGDCNDKDAKINPGALETCDGKDNNCNKVTDEGCTPCDVDGDKYAALNTSVANCKIPKTDPDDYDAGIFPNAASDSGGAEGGTVKDALRQWCSYSLAKNSTTAKKVRHRDVDHDGDKKVASGDGCPSQGCDKDGDGFKNASCKADKDKVDCNDKDSRVFPGAPDRCGDGKAQDCVKDLKCESITDKDNDRYSPPADCNDNDPAVHPWAKEVCDHRDNDCDGLIDEGNPDQKGALIPTITRRCNDNNIGECAPSCKPGSNNCSAAGKALTGVCACSAQVPNTTRGTNRVVCHGEDLKAVASPRCFGARQPQMERCDTKDWDCNGLPDDPKGLNLADKGKTCGTNKGGCKAGTVVGCDLTRTTPNANLVLSVLKKQGLTFNTHWLCSKDVLLPIPEACNGKDDNCDNSLADNEKDRDKDKYLACTGCTKGSKRTDLASGFYGCGDCNDKPNGGASVYPTAKEQCNNKDDNCSNGVSDDGKDQCTAKSATCCSTQQACRDLTTDKSNCGICGKKCDYRAADMCKKGKCVCGNKGHACSDGLNCVAGQCECLSGKSSLCKGCCLAGNCKQLSAQSASSCGSSGKACTTCSDANDCTQDNCSNGICKNVTRPYLYGCKKNGVSGKCIGTSCCTGCISGGACRTGKNVDKCGKGGGTCKICYTSNPCKARSCAAGSCTYPDRPDKYPCSGGRCFMGTCCTGCIDTKNWKCISGSSSAACGTKGDNCQKCITSNPCKVPACILGVCGTMNQVNGTSCGSGMKCLNGQCVYPDSGPGVPADAGPGT